MTGRVTIQCSISPSRQPTDRAARPPSLIGAGKSPLRTRRQIVVFDSPVTLTTSGVLSILSMVCFLTRHARRMSALVGKESPC